MDADLRIVSGTNLPPLGWIPRLAGGVPDPDLVVPVSNFVGLVGLGLPLLNKPASGGFWTSPLLSPERPELGTPWVEAAKSRSLDYADEVVEIAPVPGGAFVLVDNALDLVAATDRWELAQTDDGMWPLIPRYESRSLDFEAMAKEVDGICLTRRGLWETKRFGEHPVNTDGWDVPSVLFLHPAFSVGSRWQLDPTIHE